MKTRVVVLQDGKERKLLSLEEKRNSKDITIGLPMTHAIIHKGTILPVQSRKISIHTSPNSNPPSRTITHEIKFRPNGFHKGYANLTLQNEIPLIWPVYCQNVGLDLPRLSQAERRRDKILEISTYYTRLNAMFIGVFVTSKNFTMPNSFGLSNQIIEFDEFNISILYNFASISSPPNSLEQFNYTSVPDGTPLLSHLNHNGNLKGYEQYEVEAKLHDGFQLVGQYCNPQNRRSIKIPSYIYFQRFPRSPDGGWTKKDIKYGGGWLFSQRNPIGKRISNIPTVLDRPFLDSSGYSATNWTIDLTNSGEESDEQEKY